MNTIDFNLLNSNLFDNDYLKSLKQLEKEIQPPPPPPPPTTTTTINAITSSGGGAPILLPGLNNLSELSNHKKLSIETAKKLVSQIEAASKNTKLVVEEDNEDEEEDDDGEHDEEEFDEDEDEDEEEEEEEEEGDDNLEDDEEEDDDDDFINSISSNTFNIFNDADRLDLISKAYSLIMGEF
jgi:hypothetical protein